jgi:hypothetical protein
MYVFFIDRGLERNRSIFDKYQNSDNILTVIKCDDRISSEMTTGKSTGIISLNKKSKSIILLLFL